ncbi:DUF3618 domain-containing protein [Luteimonas sp. RD2P54]|uniref:DUF3618 domain-containing protein n=1 Tax=Luteimonas endophytica TaxID=3042023 RepID=A0ABT6J4W9_9GAMM|nr:DUF3618 domain-containing protein [Luteimonas endophytica]MDH5821862.1 DUF3618 domain-containing protein [Luteimonas endophytica]
MISQHTNHSPTGQPASNASPAQLERDIDRQREHIGGLVDALENKLSPGEMFERVLNYSKGGGREFASNLGGTVKANPVPTLLAAAGLMWLYANKDAPQRPPHTGPQHSGFAGAGLDGADWNADDDHPSMRERAREARDGVSEKMGHAKDRASGAAHNAMDSARQRARQANDGFQHMLEDNPMAVGAMGIAVGALLGAMLPSTRKEDELLGKTSDRLTDDAKSLAKRGYDRAAEAGREVSTPQHGGRNQPNAPI